MPTLENDSVVFRFPEIDPRARFEVDFQRTLRIPDTDREYSLPPGFGRFPLRHVEDYSGLPETTKTRGGLILPIWQSEALWLNFSYGEECEETLPVAIKVAAGKINAVTGEPWSAALNREPQDYMVGPDQPWLDGFSVEKGVVRQFVATSLGGGYSVEEQLTGAAQWGGLQISVTPMRRSAWEKLKRPSEQVLFAPDEASVAVPSLQMGLGAGGLLTQHIYPDQYALEDWDTRAKQRVFVTLWHAHDWANLTGESAPTQPPSAQAYQKAGLPWFQYYGDDQGALEGSDTLKAVQSVGALYKQETGQSLTGSQDIETGRLIRVGPAGGTGTDVGSSEVW